MKWTKLHQSLWRVSYQGIAELNRSEILTNDERKKIEQIMNEAIDRYEAKNAN